MSRLKKLKIQAIEEANRKVLNEDPDRDGIIQIQKFLNEKGITGDNGEELDIDGATCNDMSCQTGQAIANYQSSIGVYPVDGVWGENTMNTMSAEDKESFKSFGGWFDRLF